jgi:glycosyltransferase involved in cell wall biosynthesis
MSDGSSAARLPRVCFVTTEFHGLFRNGGIGTANTGLALALVDAGFDVTVAHANSDKDGARTKIGNFTELQAQYRERGLTLDNIPPHPLIPDAFNDPRSASLAIFDYVQHADFDVVLFNDNGGQGYFSLLAKHTGMFQNAPAMVVVAHGPIAWALDLNAERYSGREAIVAVHMEKRCAELADVLVSPSRYLIDWMTGRGWILPRHTVVIQNLVGVGGGVPGRTTTGASPAIIRELVFFGRQEIRKGLELFCDAVDSLQDSAGAAIPRITFLGKFTNAGGMHSGVYLAERGRNWRTSLRFITVYDQVEALDYLSRSGALAVIPSLAENSPCVVMECLELGLPFIATDSGGTPELVAPEDRARCLFPANIGALAARLKQVLRAGHRPARIAVRQEATASEWLRLIGTLIARREQVPPSVPAEPPLVSVCLTHTATAPCRAAVLQALLHQTYPCLEIVVATSGGTIALPDGDPAARLLRVVDASAEPGTSLRHVAARHARGDFLLFLHAASVALPDCVETLVTAAQHTGAEILSGLPSLGSSRGSPPTVPIGACLPLGALENCFGETVVFVSAHAYRRGNGYAEPCEETFSDWLFLAKSVADGRVLEVVPRPLVKPGLTRPSGFDAGRSIRHHRRVMQIYRDMPVSSLGGVVELALSPGARSTDALHSILQRASLLAQQAARRMAAMEPDSAEANQAFSAYLCERRLAPVAMDFAVFNDVALLPGVAIRARTEVEAAALDAIRETRFDFSCLVDLTGEVRQRLSVVPPQGVSNLSDALDVAAAHPPGADTGILKAAGVCPPGTVEIRAMAQAEGGPGLLAAIAVCDPRSGQVLSHDFGARDGDAGWSGWRRIDGGGGEIVVTIPAPLDYVRDLYLVNRCDPADHGKEARIIWQHIEARIGFRVGGPAGNVESDADFLPIPLETLRQGTLVTDVSDFPFPVFVPGERTMLHPVPGKIALVRFAGAFPAGASGLRGIVSVARPEAHPIEFGVWIMPASIAARGEAELAGANGFSGWLTVREPQVPQEITVTLKAPACVAMDVYLATRVTTAPDVHFCHAYWEDLQAIYEPA